MNFNDERLGKSKADDALEERDEIFAQQELSYELREPRAVLLKVETKWDNLHDDPRFQNLLRRVGFQQ